MKDINTIVALLKGKRIDPVALDQRLSGLNHEPALIVECSRVMTEIKALVEQAVQSL